MSSPVNSQAYNDERPIGVATAIAIVASMLMGVGGLIIVSTWMMASLVQCMPCHL